MTRIRFEDLPSRNTPRNAENLNKLNNVVISPTEPTTGEEVWIKSGGKNFFNKNKATLQYIVLKDNGTTTSAEIGAVSDYIIVEKLESIILSGPTIQLSNGGAFYDSSKTYISGFTLNEILSGVSVPSNAKYVRVNTSKAELDTTQLEEGLVVTEYEPHVDKEIYAKNENGVYEQITNEIVQNALGQTYTITTLLNTLFNSKDTGIGSGTSMDTILSRPGLRFYSVWGSKPIGLPTGAYEYGVLIVFVNKPNTPDHFSNIQIYITASVHTASSSTTNHGVYVRTGKNSWARLYGGSASATS